MSSLIDENGNLSAAALAQLEPNGHSLLPQPFMAGISSLDEHLNGKQSNSAVRQRTNMAIQKQMISQTNSKGSGSNYNSGQGGTKTKSATRANSKNAQKKKMLLEAYNLDQYNLI